MSAYILLAVLYVLTFPRILYYLWYKSVLSSGVSEEASKEDARKAGIIAFWLTPVFPFSIIILLLVLLIFNIIFNESILKRFSKIILYITGMPE